MVQDKDCSCCRNARKNDGKIPRALVPVIYQNNKVIHLCPACDGDALKNAQDLQAKGSAG